MKDLFVLSTTSLVCLQVARESNNSCWMTRAFCLMKYFVVLDDRPKHGSGPQKAEIGLFVSCDVILPEDPHQGDLIKLGEFSQKENALIAAFECPSREQNVDSSEKSEDFEQELYRKLS